ncbi:MAG: hypothetical protein RQ732_09840 [Methylophaga sp.]|nr:hypothetical protein [Methylophaga sp.]
MAEINANTLPTVTPPWLQQSQQQPQQTTRQNAPQQQQQQQQFQQPKTDYLGVAGKLFAKPIGNTIGSYFGAGGAATGIGGASGAIAAGGGSYVTGSGLAGTASAINTTAGAAGSSAGGFTSGLKGSLKGGLGAGIAGFAGGFLGDKIFGGQGGTGGSIGASIGFAVNGPLGAALGGLLGGAVGGLFGGGKKRSYYSMAFGDKGMSSLGAGTTYDTALGKIKIYGRRDGGKAIKPALDAIRKSDEQVAAMFDDDQLVRAKQGIAAAKFNQGTRWTQNPQRAETILKNTVKARYASAVSGLDNHYGSVFNRIADDKNMGGLISTFAQLDKDIQNGGNIFAGKNVKNGQQAINVIAETYGLADKKPAPKSMTTQRPTELAKPTGPVWSGGISLNYNSVNGYRYDSFTQSWSRRHGGGGILGMGSSYGSILKSKQAAWDNEKKKLDQANSKALGAWEKKVLDAYVNNYQAGQQNATIHNTAQSIGSVGVARQQTVDGVQGSPATRRNRLFGSINQQSVKLNRANQSSSASTNAGGLLQQSEVA